MLLLHREKAVLDVLVVLQPFDVFELEPQFRVRQTTKVFKLVLKVYLQLHLVPLVVLDIVSSQLPTREVHGVAVLLLHEEESLLAPSAGIAAVDEVLNAVRVHIEEHVELMA